MTCLNEKISSENEISEIFHVKVSKFGMRWDFPLSAVLTHQLSIEGFASMKNEFQNFIHE